MSRKRFVFSLADSDCANGTRRTNAQIVFTLTPGEPLPCGRLYETVHPIVWNVFDLDFGQPVSFEHFSDLAVCTAMKTSDATVMPVLWRIVPRGHYTALTRAQGQLMWCKTAKWQEDAPDSIVIMNESQINQAFALCATTIEKGEFKPKVFPIVLFNQIPHKKNLQMKTSLVLRAYLAQGFNPMKQIRGSDQLPAVLDENGKEWVVELDEIITPVTYWCIHREENGKVKIVEQKESDTRGSPGGELDQYIQDQVRAKMESYMKEIQAQIQHATPTTTPGQQNEQGRTREAVKQLEDRITKVEDKVETLDSRAKKVRLTAVDTLQNGPEFPVTVEEASEKPQKADESSNSTRRNSPSSGTNVTFNFRIN